MMVRNMILLALSIVAGAVFAEKMPPLPAGAFTYAVIPDTQGYDGEGRHTKRGRTPGVGPTVNPKLDAVTEWLVANAAAENIKFVSHTGDLTDMNNDPQWAFASKAMGRLDGKIPYGIAAGNHDMVHNGDTSLFRKYFPASRFSSNAWYAGTFGGFVNSAGVAVSGDNANSCCLFEEGGEKFVVVHLECNAPDPALKWAGAMLEKYADRHAIIATHQDLGAIDPKDGRKIAHEMAAMKAAGGNPNKDYVPDLATLGRMKWHKCHGKEDGNSGYDIWAKFTSRYRNVFLVVSGDQGMVKITRVDEKGVNGNMVYSLMQDTGAGFIRIFRFVPAEKAVKCYTIDPSKGGEIVHDYHCWHDDAWFNFTLPYPGTDGTATPIPTLGAPTVIDPAAREKVARAEKEGRKGDKKTKAKKERVVSTKPGRVARPCATAGTRDACPYQNGPSAGYEVKPLVPAEYKAFLLKDRETRKREFADVATRTMMAKKFPKNAPLGVTLTWPGTKGGELEVTRIDGEETGPAAALPWRKTFFKGNVPSNSYSLVNLEIARTYRWSVKTPEGGTAGGTFRTEDFAPRIISWPGIPNVRDLGGRKGLNGRRVKQGLVYRSAGLNNNADWDFLKEKDLVEAHADGTLEAKLAKTISGSGEPTDAKHYVKRISSMLAKGEKLPKRYCDRKFLRPDSAKPGKARLTEATAAWGRDWLGIRTDLDLRCFREVWGMKGSPLGPQVKWLQYASSNYDGMAGETGRAAFVKCFRVFLDEKNYPIDFHCIAGADRTGSLACILNGLLGVDEEELYRDWEVTGFVNANAEFNHKRLFDKLIAVFDKYEGATLNDRIEAYVLSCGFTKDDIAKLRSIMLE